MPRKRNPADGPPPPKAPRVRKKKAEQEPKMEPQTYEHQMMAGNGMIMDDGSGMYTQDYGYAYGSQAPFGGPDTSTSPFLMPTQSNTPQPQMMMRGMAGPPQTSGLGPGVPTPNLPMGPAPSPLEFRIHEMNRRLYIFHNSGISEKDYNQWWDAFSHEFFEDEARLCIRMPVPDENGIERPDSYTLTRQSIPRYFRSFAEGHVRELYFILQGATREQQTQTGSFIYENDSCLQITKVVENHTCPLEARTECKFTIEFTPYDEMLNYRIRHWTIDLRSCQEFFVNEMTKEVTPNEQLTYTRFGLVIPTLQHLQLAKLIEPMTSFIGFTKSAQSCNTTPKLAMKSVIFNHFRMSADRAQVQQQMMSAPQPEEPKPKPQRKRTRKPPANPKSKKTNASPAPSNPSFPPNPVPGTMNAYNPMGVNGFQDVMVVGEPSMMGGDYGEDDERTISRVENSQYDPSALQMQQNMSMGGPHGMMGGPGLPPPGGPMGHMPAPNGMPNHNMAQVPPQMQHMLGQQNGMPPPYSYGQAQPGTWPGQPPNTTMITG